jgi:cytidylate kinase
MKNFLEDYFQQKFQASRETIAEPGPVVTISRAFGCEAKPISIALAKRLNTYHIGIGQKSRWEIITKEILEEAAKELQTNSKKIEYIFQFEKRTAIDDFLMSMTSRKYQSDWKVKEAVKNVVRTFAFKGYMIIVGRAGAQITRDIPNSLHIQLVAQMDWRVKRIAEKHHLSQKQALENVNDMDEKRRKLIEMFSKDAGCHNCYDVQYNPQYLSSEMIVSDIIHMMQLKKLI